MGSQEGQGWESWGYLRIAGILSPSWPPNSPVNPINSELLQSSAQAVLENQPH